MRKLVLSVFAFLIPLFVFVQVSWAKVYKPVTSPSAMPTPTAAPKEINSFELFWPVVAGKTIESKLYSLKIFKEDLRGLLIFGRSQKADYEVFLATKRVLEAEALVNNGKKDLGIKTLDRASDYIKRADDNLSSVSLSDENISETKKKLENLDIFLKWYENKSNGEVKNKLIWLHDKINSLLSEIKS